jgi:hypothetical protein
MINQQEIIQTIKRPAPKTSTNPTSKTKKNCYLCLQSSICLNSIKSLFLLNSDRTISLITLALGLRAAVYLIARKQSRYSEIVDFLTGTGLFTILATNARKEVSPQKNHPVAREMWWPSVGGDDGILTLDGRIRDFVLFPIAIVMFLQGILKHYIAIAMSSNKKLPAIEKVTRG